jgi:iron(III) transport system permease protein
MAEAVGALDYPTRRPVGRSGAPALLVVPALVVGLLALLPIGYLAIRAAGAEGGVGELLLRPRTLTILWQTVALAATVTVASILVAVPIVWLTMRTDLPWRRAWIVATILPLVIPSYVGGFAIVAAFGPRGALQSFLEPLGVDRLPALYGFPGAALTLTLFSFPYVVLSVRAAMRRLDPGFEEVGRSLGLGPWAVFLRVVLPQLRPAILAGALLVALYTLSDFGAVSLLQFESFTQAIYVQYRASLNRELAAALSLMLVGLTVVLLAAEAGLRGRGSYHRSGAGVARSARTVRLGAWRWPAVAWCGVVVALGVGLPVATVGFWLGRAASIAEPIAPALAATFNSALVSGLAALLTAVAALPVAILAVRHRGPLASLAERASYIGFALPGIVIGLGFVFFAANYAPWIYKTLPLLLAAYLVRFIPQAVGTTRSSMLQVSPRVEEAARTLGRSPGAVLREVTIPLVRPGLAAGAALVFLTAMKELPATMLLAPIGFDTLAVRIWSATSEGFYARAAVPALLMIGVSAASLWFLLRREPAGT